MTRRVIHTDRAPARPGFSQAVVAGNLLFVSGTVGMDMMTGGWPSGIEAQGEQAIEAVAVTPPVAGGPRTFDPTNQ